MYKNATKCNETIGKWCKDKHGASKIIDTFETYHRPYLAIDSTFLTDRFNGQLPSATAIDGHNWMYSVSFGVFDSEIIDNWTWFMQLLKQAIGSPSGLAICTDASQIVMTGVKECSQRQNIWSVCTT
jgi:hypothetical protein